MKKHWRYLAALAALGLCFQAAIGAEPSPAVHRPSVRVTESAASALFALKDASLKRYTEDPALVANLLSNLKGSAIPKPAKAADATLTTWKGQAQRVYELWTKAGIARALPEGKCFRAPAAVAAATSWPRCKPVPDTRKVKLTRLILEPTARIVPHSVDELNDESEYVTYGRTVALLDHYFIYPDEERLPTAVYLYQVAGLIKTRGERRIDYLKVAWVDSPPNACYPLHVPVPQQGDDFILTTTPMPRSQVYGTRETSIHDRLRITRDYGEHYMRGDFYSNLRIVNGRTAPIDPNIAPESYGAFFFYYPEPALVFGQPWRPYLEYLRLGLNTPRWKSRALSGHLGRQLLRPSD